MDLLVYGFLLFILSQVVIPSTKIEMAAYMGWYESARQTISLGAGELLYVSLLLSASSQVPVVFCVFYNFSHDVLGFRLISHGLHGQGPSAREAQFLLTAVSLLPLSVLLTSCLCSRNGSWVWSVLSLQLVAALVGETQEGDDQPEIAAITVFSASLSPICFFVAVMLC